MTADYISMASEAITGNRCCNAWCFMGAAHPTRTYPVHRRLQVRPQVADLLQQLLVVLRLHIARALWRLPSFSAGTSDSRKTSSVVG